MHIPDNYLSPVTCVVMGAVMIPVWTRCVKKVTKEISKKRLPMLGIGAAFSFLVMMFNVPLPGGTTGHAVGASLVAILLGPYAATLCVTIALLIQALFFGDGGLLAIGANCFNMAFIMPFVSYYIYSFVKEKISNEKLQRIGTFLAAYIGITVAALFAAIEFGIQPIFFKDAAGLPLYCPYPLSVSVPAMVVPHLLVAGVVEGLVTVTALAFVKKISKNSIYEGKEVTKRPLYGLLVAMIILSPIGLLASGTAWGEWGTDEIASVSTGGKTLGFIPKAMESGINFKALMADYGISGVNENIGYLLSAVIGVALIIIVFKMINMMVRKKQAN